MQGETCKTIEQPIISVANFKRKLLFAVTQVLDLYESPFIEVKQESELESLE